MLGSDTLKKPAIAIHQGLQPTIVDNPYATKRNFIVKSIKNNDADAPKPELLGPADRRV